MLYDWGLNREKKDHSWSSDENVFLKAGVREIAKVCNNRAKDPANPGNWVFLEDLWDGCSPSRKNCMHAGIGRGRRAQGHHIKVWGGL